MIIMIIQRTDLSYAVAVLRCAIVVSFGVITTAPVVFATTFTQVKTTTTSASQQGFYYLWAYGNAHNWAAGGLPSPNPRGDGLNYAEWMLTFDLSQLPRGSSITSAVLNASWTIKAPTIFPALWSWSPLNAVPTSSRQPIKYMTVDSAGWLTRLVFSDGFTYQFSGSPRQNPNSLNLLSLGLQSHLANSAQVTLVGTLQYGLGRAYLDDSAGDDWQDAKGWAYSCTNNASGTGVATGSGTLSVSFEPAPKSLWGSFHWGDTYWNQ